MKYMNEYCTLYIIQYLSIPHHISPLDRSHIPTDKLKARAHYFAGAYFMAVLPLAVLSSSYSEAGVVLTVGVVAAVLHYLVASLYGPDKPTDDAAPPASVAPPSVAAAKRKDKPKRQQARQQV